MKLYILIVTVLIGIGLFFGIALGQPKDDETQTNTYYPLPEETFNPQRTVDAKELQPAAGSYER